ncbi:WXG100 family type VII secretion target [Arsenicicoccus piscis]|nr:WXG100 family type VII secretion target [Arsenicicoccus piscis]MCH8627942.1 WXG100 family type VII secretion target [Arsenicicoccus piscis]
MSAQFRVDTDRIVAASGDVARISGDIEAQVATLMARLTGLQDAWQGSASAGFQSVMEQWRATQAQVRESLDSINHLLAQAGAQYAETEQANTAMFAR